MTSPASRPPKPDGCPWIIPFLMADDGENLIAFYQRAFGAELCADPLRDESGTVVHADLRLCGGMVMVGKEGAFGTSPCPPRQGVPQSISLYVFCENVDTFYEKAVQEGAISVMAPQTQFWGDRVCKLIDPEGHEWCFATNVADFDPSKIPSPTA